LRLIHPVEGTSFAIMRPARTAGGDRSGLPSAVTDLLLAWRGGDAGALQPTALVHEAYLRLVSALNSAVRHRPRIKPAALCAP
jgi:hypothetical protein